MTPLARPAARNAQPHLHGTELAAIGDALLEGQYGHSHITERFEREVAAFLGVPDVVAVSSCTTALQIALLAAGVGPGDDVVVPSQTFCATIQAILAVGAAPRFADIDPVTLCVTADTVGEAITRATKAVLPVLYGGRAVELTPIAGLLADRQIAVVEDAAHAFGSWQGDIRVGATGVLTCFSFGPIKNLTCIEGGAIVPRTPQEAATIRTLRTLGIVQPQTERVRSAGYTVQGTGLRGTMSAVHAAVGLAQLERFDDVSQRRQDLWRAYASAVSGIEHATLVDVDIERTIPFNLVVRVPARDRVFTAMHDQGIAAGVHYPPNHLQPAFAAWHRPLPVTEQTGEEILSLPFHLAMTDDDVRHVAQVLDDAIDAALSATLR